MYKIYADDVLIYDSTIEDYKIGKGSVSLETNKSGSFTFSLYQDHFYYDSFVRLKTIITVYKAGRIIFRGRVLKDTTDYHNNKVLTCEGELGFLQDSIIRPFNFTGTAAALFTKLINEHNAQVDASKRFKIGTVTVNANIERGNEDYESALDNLDNQLLSESTGGYLYITHGDDGSDEMPTINYIADFTRVASQTVEFGSNLKDYTKTVKAEDIATAIIPLGKETDGVKLTIASVNNGVDYVYSENGVAMYGWIYKIVEFNDITSAAALKAAADEYLNNAIQQNITIELDAIDLHLMDKSIESFALGDYIRVVSAPHNFDATLLCNKQTIDLLKPENDTLTLGYTYSTFTESSSKALSSARNIQSIKTSVGKMTTQVTNIDSSVQVINTQLESMRYVTGSLECPELAAGAHSDVAVTHEFGFMPSIVLFVDDITATTTVNAGGCYTLVALAGTGFTVRCRNVTAATVAKHAVKYIAFV